MVYEIKINKNNLKSKERFYNDNYLCNLVKLIITYKGTFKIHTFIRDLLYLKNIEEYETILTKYLIIHDIHHEIILKIYDLFTNWVPFEKYNLGELRGNYLEMLCYEYLQQEYSEKIYRESNIKIGDYISHTWDLILELEEYLNLYECKFSLNSLKRKHINQVISLKNKLSTSNIYIIIYETNELLEFKLMNLRENTKKDQYKQILSNINFITLEKL